MVHVPTSVNCAQHATALAPTAVPSRPAAASKQVAAAQVAQMLGATVVASNEFTDAGSPFVQQQPNLMVEMPDGRRINAGLVASFYAHGYPQSYINTLIAAQANT